MALKHDRKKRKLSTVGISVCPAPDASDSKDFVISNPLSPDLANSPQDEVCFRNNKDGRGNSSDTIEHRPKKLVKPVLPSLPKPKTSVIKRKFSRMCSINDSNSHHSNGTNNQQRRRRATMPAKNNNSNNGKISNVNGKHTNVNYSNKTKPKCSNNNNNSNSNNNNNDNNDSKKQQQQTGHKRKLYVLFGGSDTGRRRNGQSKVNGTISHDNRKSNENIENEHLNANTGEMIRDNSVDNGCTSRDRDRDNRGFLNSLDNRLNQGMGNAKKKRRLNACKNGTNSNSNKNKSKNKKKNSKNKNSINCNNGNNNNVNGRLTNMSRMAMVVPMIAKSNSDGNNLSNFQLFNNVSNLSNNEIFVLSQNSLNQQMNNDNKFGVKESVVYFCIIYR